MTIAVGKMVAVPSRRELGVGRLERILEPDAGSSTARVRVFFYDLGRFEILSASDVIPVPPGVWQKPAAE